MLLVPWQKLGSPLAEASLAWLRLALQCLAVLTPLPFLLPPPPPPELSLAQK